MTGLLSGGVITAQKTPDAGRALLQRLRFCCDFILNRPGREHETDSHDAGMATRLARAYEHELRTGLRVLIVGFGIVGVWAAAVPLSGAVVVAGSLVTESSVKKIQHPTGGVVAQILARDGMHVHAGDLVVRLDETVAQANLQVLTKQLDAVRMRIARLAAERDEAAEPNLPREMAARADDKDIQQLFLSEQALFKARATSRYGQKDLLRSRIAQLEEQITGLNAQIKSQTAQRDLITSELTGIESLYEKKLVPLTRLTSLQREAARLDGSQGQLISSIAETHSKISEAQLQMVRVDQDLRSEVMKDLRDAQDKEAELAERSIAAQDQLNRIEIRAPKSGVVHQLSVHTVGGVITPAEVLMVIVPDADDLLIEAHLPPKEVDQVQTGQKAIIRLSAFNQRTTPQLNGAVSFVSADASEDKKTNASYYTVRVTLPEEELKRLGGLQLISGMPAEVFLETGSRTMLSYMFKPITDQLERMFRER
jgi:HlyD family secretion protein